MSFIRLTVLATVVLVATATLDVVDHHEALAEQHHRYSVKGDVFYNYYNWSPRAGGTPAQLYMAPRPTPPLVGHTYITYQPLMPHEFLYQHTRNYWSKSSSGSWSYTKVKCR